MVFDLALLPVWYQYTLLAFLGAVIGSFVNVVVYRMHTGVSISGRSRCFSCGTQLQWFELVPGISYVALRGMCRSCGAQIPRRDFIAEITLALAFVALAASTASVWALVLGLVLATVLLMVMLYDITHLIIPNEFVVVLAVLGAGVLGWGWWQTGAYMPVVWALVAALAAFVSYGSLWWYSGGRWIGLGDAKLAAALGLFLSPAQVFSMVVLSFWVGAFFGLALLLAPRVYRASQRLYARLHPGVVALERLRPGLTMKSELPFAPFIIIAFGLVYLYNVVVVDLISYGITF